MATSQADLGRLSPTMSRQHPNQQRCDQAIAIIPRRKVLFSSSVGSSSSKVPLLPAVLFLVIVTGDASFLELLVGPNCLACINTSLAP